MLPLVESVGAFGEEAVGSRRELLGAGWRLRLVSALVANVRGRGSLKADGV